MTYDLKVILKYCGRSSHDLLVLCGWSWPLSGPKLAILAAHGAYVGDLGSLSGPMLAVLGRPLGLGRRSWERIRA